MSTREHKLQANGINAITRQYNLDVQERNPIPSNWSTIKICIIKEFNNSNRDIGDNIMRNH